MDSKIKLYAVQSKDGKWFRAKGICFNGMCNDGVSWVSDLTEAKFYKKMGPAKSCVTWWYNNYPKYGIANVVEFDVVPCQVIDQTQRVQKIYRS